MSTPANRSASSERAVTRVRNPPSEDRREGGIAKETVVSLYRFAFYRFIRRLLARRRAQILRSASGLALARELEYVNRLVNARVERQPVLQQAKQLVLVDLEQHACDLACEVGVRPAMIRKKK